MTDLFDKVLATRLGLFAIMLVGLSALVASIFAVYELGYWIAGENLGTIAVLVYLLALLAVLATTE